MRDIREVIAAAREQGYDLEHSEGRALRTIAPKTWFLPATGHVIRNEGGELPYVVYSIRGFALARMRRQSDARRFQSLFPVAAPEPNLIAYGASGGLPMSLLLSDDDMQRWHGMEKEWARFQPMTVPGMPGPWVQVQDQISGLCYEVRSATRGTEARRVNPNEAVIGE